MFISSPSKSALYGEQTHSLNRNVLHGMIFTHKVRGGGGRRECYYTVSRRGQHEEAKERLLVSAKHAPERYPGDTRRAEMCVLRAVSWLTPVLPMCQRPKHVSRTL